MEWDIAGAQVAVAKDGHIIYAKGYGWADLKLKNPMSDNFRFRLGSMSKVVTAIAVLRLWQERKLNLDAPIAALFGIANSRNLPHGVGALTSRHLLTMCSGFADASPDFACFCNARIGPIGRDTRLSMDDVVAFLKVAKLDAAPGKRQHYEQASYHILGRIVEVASGLRYEDYVISHVFSVLGIDGPFIGSTQRAFSSNGEVCYYTDRDEIMEPTRGLEGAIRDTPPYASIVVQTRDSNGGWVMSASELSILLCQLVPSAPETVLGSAARRLARLRPKCVLPDASEYFGMGQFCRPVERGLNLQTLFSRMPWATCSLSGQRIGSCGGFGITTEGLVWVLLMNKTVENWSGLFGSLHAKMWRAMES